MENLLKTKNYSTINVKIFLVPEKIEELQIKINDIKSLFPGVDFKIDKNNYKKIIMQEIYNLMKKCDNYIGIAQYDFSSLFDAIKGTLSFAKHYFIHHTEKPKFGSELRTHDDIMKLISHFILSYKEEYTERDIFDITRKEIDKSTLQVTANNLLAMVKDVFCILSESNMIERTDKAKYITRFIKEVK